MGKVKFVTFFLITELFLVINEPYALRWILPLPDLAITAIIYFVFLLFMVLNIAKAKLLPISINFCFLVSITVWFFYSVYFSDTSYITRIVLLLITYIFLVCLNRKDDFYKFWKFNNRFILIQAFMGALCFFFVAIGILRPLITISDPSGSLREFSFYGGCFSKSIYGSLIRPAGFLDEPGALAAWAVFGLLINYAFIKDNLLRKHLPYLTLTTLSVAYFIQMGLFLVLKNIRKIQNIISVVFLLIVLILGVYQTKDTDFDVYARTIGRFTLDEEKTIAGNSRQRHMENAMLLFKQSPIIGVGARNMGEKEELLNDNPYEILAKDGIIGYIISYLPLIMVLFFNRRKEILICWIVLFAGYQQRPLHVNFMHDMYIWSFLLFALMDAKEGKWLQYKLRMEQNEVQQQKKN